MCVLRHTCHPAPCAPQAHPKGNPTNIHPGHRFARPHLAGASATRYATWAERSNGPCGCSAAHPLLAAPAAGRLGGEHGRRSAHASLTDSPWLSERRAPAQSEFHGAPRNRPDAGLPRSEAQGSQTGGRLSFAYFSLAKQRKVSRPPGRQPGLRPQHKHAFQTSAPRLRQAQPERYVANRGAIKTIAASAFYTSASRQNH